MFAKEQLLDRHSSCGKPQTGLHPPIPSLLSSLHMSAASFHVLTRYHLQMMHTLYDTRQQMIHHCGTSLLMTQHSICIIPRDNVSVGMLAVCTAHGHQVCKLLSLPVWMSSGMKRLKVIWHEQLMVFFVRSLSFDLLQASSRPACQGMRLSPAGFWEQQEEVFWECGWATSLARSMAMASWALLAVLARVASLAISSSDEPGTAYSNWFYISLNQFIQIQPK